MKLSKSDQKIFYSLIQDLGDTGLPENQILWLVTNSFLNLRKYKFYLKHALINSHLDGFLYYWVTEYSWCTQNPIWSNAYSELEYYFIRALLQAFPNHPIIQEYLNSPSPINFN